MDCCGLKKRERLWKFNQCSDCEECSPSKRQQWVGRCSWCYMSTECWLVKELSLIRRSPSRGRRGKTHQWQKNPWFHLTTKKLFFFIFCLLTGTYIHKNKSYYPNIFKCPHYRLVQILVRLSDVCTKLQTEPVWILLIKLYWVFKCWTINLASYTHAILLLTVLPMSVIII